MNLDIGSLAHHIYQSWWDTGKQDAYLAQSSFAQGNPVRGLVLAILNSVLEVLLLCLAGYILASKGILDASAKKALNHLNVSFLTPALLFSKIAYTLTPETLFDLAIVPFGWLLVTIVGISGAYMLGYIFRLRKIERQFAMAVAMSPNANSFPVAVIQSLILQHVPLKWGPHDNKDNMLGRALTYLMLFATLGTIARWSIGVRLLSSVEGMTTPASSNITIPSNNNRQQAISLPTNAPNLDDDDEHNTLDHPAHPKSWRNSIRRAWTAFAKFMTVPLWASLISIVIALLPPAQALLKDITVLKSTLKNAGNCAVPINIIVLGAYFYTPPSPENESYEISNASHQNTVSQKITSIFRSICNTFSPHTLSTHSSRTIIVASVARMVFTPLVCIPLLRFYIMKFDTVADDPVFVVCACLLSGGPAAITLAQVTAQSSGKLFESLISKTLFVNYIILATPVTIALVLAGLFIANET